MKKLVINQAEFKGLINSLCQQIAVSGWVPDYIVGITRGGLVPAVMISQYFQKPLETLKVSLRDGGGTETNAWMSEDAFDGKKILIVDDINDSGATINWIIEDWQGSCLPNRDRWKHVWNENVKFAIVVDNQSSRANVDMDFVGMTINKNEDDVWVDFPYEDWWTK